MLLVQHDNTCKVEAHETIYQHVSVHPFASMLESHATTYLPSNRNTWTYNRYYYYYLGIIIYLPMCIPVNLVIQNIAIFAFGGGVWRDCPLWMGYPT